ncbi:hypothetical protein EK904_000904 [Melospiza melodia maxima]|nr:hypothetical protein EK904_000904 [Melospiza melodia maxima]
MLPAQYGSSNNKIEKKVNQEEFQRGFLLERPWPLVIRQKAGIQPGWSQDGDRAFASKRVKASSTTHHSQNLHKGSTSSSERQELLLLGHALNSNFLCNNAANDSGNLIRYPPEKKPQKSHGILDPFSSKTQSRRDRRHVAGGGGARRVRRAEGGCGLVCAIPQWGYLRRTEFPSTGFFREFSFANKEY